jgi:predicted Zn-dependent peptidase
MRLLAQTAFVALLAHAASGHAQPAPPAPEAARSPPASLHLDVKRARLDNGLRVVLLVDHTTPTVAIDVVYDVGARNEDRGRSGFAHLFENMMFQGSRNVLRGEHSKLVSAHGGHINRSTTADRTNYSELLPSRELALGLWLEADRMQSLDISQTNFDNQRSVVKEAYRKSIEDTAYARASLRLLELVFQGYWPYEHPAIGTMRDLDAAQLASVQTFHDAYYAPNNAVVSIVGDFDEAEGLALVKRYFGEARAQPKVPRYAPPAVPEQTAPRSSVVEDAHAKLPALFNGWLIPGGHEPDHYALELAALLLGDGDSSRLRRSLVRKRSLAIDVSASVNGHRGPDLFEIVVKLATGARIDQVGKLLDAQLADIARVGPTDEEIRKLRNRIRAHMLFGLQSNLARAAYLADMELGHGDATLVNAELDNYLAVTKEDIKRVVAKYLTAAQRSTVEVKPGEKN